MRLFRRQASKENRFASHISQDRWVSDVFQQRRNGYFLDFGAFDGIDLSNTLHLERTLGWKGICVEPNPTYYPKLCATRTAICVNLALWPLSRRVVELVDAHGLSSISQFKQLDSNATTRETATRRVIEVDTINPTELMDRFEAPREIEYMSLDVEGAEYDILTGIDFHKYNILLMTIENDCSIERQIRVRNYLSQFGYVGLQLSYDDFFFKPNFEYPVSPAIVAKALGCQDEGLASFI